MSMDYKDVVKITCTSEVLTSRSKIKCIVHLTDQTMSTFHLFTDTDPTKM